MENNRRTFLTSLFKGVITAAVAPQIVTHGLKLIRKESLYLPSYDFFDVNLFYNKFTLYLARTEIVIGNQKVIYDLPDFISPTDSSHD